MELNEINTTTKEGKLLLMAVAALTCSPKINLNGKDYNGRKLTPFMVLDELQKTVSKVFSKPLSEQN